MFRLRARRPIRRMRPSGAAAHGARVRRVCAQDTGVSKGFGFVSFTDPASADAAMASMNGAMIGGRQIRIEKTAEDH